MVVEDELMSTTDDEVFVYTGEGREGREFRTISSVL
jgi:hypothetical protein